MMKMENTFKKWKSFLKEDVYYAPEGSEPSGPIALKKVARDIIKYIIREYPELYKTAELEFKGGKRVLRFTNFGSLKQRDRVIRDLAKQGWLSAPEPKRLEMYHRARTNFVDRTTTKSGKPGKEYPIILQFDQGGGPALAGSTYEDEMAMVLNKMFQEYNLEYRAKKEGGSSNNPDIVVYTDDSLDKPSKRFEVKTIYSSDFGQFQVAHNPETGDFYQKTQLESEQLSDVFEQISDIANDVCSVVRDESYEILEIPDEKLSRKLGEIVEDYYREKGVDYIIVKDSVYSTTGDSSQSIPRFKDSAIGGYIRIRRKCHGKKYSTTAALKFDKIKPSPKIYEEGTFEKIFK